jgi:hypothetical protein
MLSNRNSLMFRRHTASIFMVKEYDMRQESWACLFLWLIHWQWRRWQYIPTNCRWISTGLHSVTSQMIVLFVVITLRTSDAMTICPVKSTSKFQPTHVIYNPWYSPKIKKSCYTDIPLS